jgi:hypothetical protein
MLADPGDDAEAPGPTLDRFDLEIVEFMLTWAPYGGPTEEECMPLFGMTPARLETRFRTIVRTGQRRWLSEDDCALLERADAHLAISSVAANETEDRPSKPQLAPPGRWVLQRGVWLWR